MTEMTLQQAETFVSKNPNARWNGWDLELLIEDPSAEFNKAGVFQDGKWYKRRVIAANGKGLYSVSSNYARLLKATRDRSK